MRILIYNFSIPYLLSDNDEFEGGTAVELLNWIKAFRGLNHEVALLTWKGAKEIIKTKVDFDIIESYNSKAGIPKIRMFYNYIPSVIRAIKNYDPDIIIQEGASVQSFIMSISSKLTKKIFVHRIASDADVDERTNEFIDGISLFLYKNSRNFIDVFSVQNEYQFNKLKERFPDKNIFKIHNTFNRFISNGILPREERKYVAWVGHFRKIKNLITLADICSQMKNIEFKIAGIAYINLDNDSSLAIEKMKRMSNVEFVGYIDNSQIQNFLSRAVCLLNTSFLEGFSNTFLEAWSVGTPIVTTNQVNPDNLIGNHQIGLVANSFEELPNKLVEIYSYADYEYNKISKRCYEYVIQNHDPTMLAKTFISKIMNF